MATYTITTAQNYDALTTPAGDDTFNINAGGTLTIDTDTRYCANHNATTGNLGTVAVAAGGRLYVDGTQVKLLKFGSKSGAFNVPAIGTTITDATTNATAYLLGVWSDLKTMVAVGAAMPATGYLKVKTVSGSFGSSNHLNCPTAGGNYVVANAAIANGWIEVVGVESRRMSCNRMGSVEFNGAWFDVGSSTGSGQQSFQLPATLTNTFYGGVWVETSNGSGVYEFWPSVGPNNTSVYGTNSTQGKICWIDAQGALLIAKTSYGGYVPANGCKIRIPNIILVNCCYEQGTCSTSKAIPSIWSTVTGLTVTGSLPLLVGQMIRFYDASNAANFFEGYIASYSGTTMTVTVTLTGGSGTISSWKLTPYNASQAMSTNSWQLSTRQITVGQSGPIGRYGFDGSAYSGPLTMTNVVYGWYPLWANAYSLTFTDVALCDYHRIENIVTPVSWTRVGIGISTGRWGQSTRPCSPQSELYNTIAGSASAPSTFTNCVFVSLAAQYLGADATQNVNLCQGYGIAFFKFDHCKFMYITDRTSGSGYVWLATSALNVTFDTCTQIGGYISLTNGVNILFKNTIYCDTMTGTTLNGTQANVIWAGQRSTNVMIDGLTLPVASNNPYSGLMNWQNTQQLTMRNIGTAASPLDMGGATTGTADLMGLGVNLLSGGNTNVKFQQIYLSNLRGTSILSNLAADAGFILEDVWVTTSSQAMPSSPCCNAIQFRGVKLGGTIPTAFTNVYGTIFYDNFTGTTSGQLGLFMNEPEAIMTPYVTLSGNVAGTDGWDSGGKLYLSTLNAQCIFEYPWWIKGYTAFSASAVTVTGGNTGNITLSYSINKNDGAGWSAYGTYAATLASVSVSPSLGFKVRIKAVCSSAAVNYLTGLQITMVCTSASQSTNTYPLDPVDTALTLTGLQNPTEVRVYLTADDTELTGTENVTSGTFTYAYTWTGVDVSVYIRVFSLGYLAISYTGQTLGSAGLTIPVQQFIDRQYLNP